MYEIFSTDTVCGVSDKYEVLYKIIISYEKEGILWDWDSMNPMTESIHSMLEWIPHRFWEVTYLVMTDFVAGKRQKRTITQLVTTPLGRRMEGTNSFSPKRHHNSKLYNMKTRSVLGSPINFFNFPKNPPISTNPNVTTQSLYLFMRTLRCGEVIAYCWWLWW